MHTIVHLSGGIGRLKVTVAVDVLDVWDVFLESHKLLLEESQVDT